jgi:hypothetical protein
MPTPGFPADTLDREGFPVWITGLADEYGLGIVHVVRGLAPRDALQAVGARPGLIRPCQLPGQRPDGRTSLPRAAIGATDSAVLLAGQFGAWTLIYDDSGMTDSVEDYASPNGFAPTAKMMSADGREAATSSFNIEADRSLCYAADGEVLFETHWDVDPEQDDIPAGLRAAVEAAGKLGSEGGDDDMAINMRVACALAGLNITLEDLRKIPLLAAELG